MLTHLKPFIRRTPTYRKQCTYNSMMRMSNKLKASLHSFHKNNCPLEKSFTVCLNRTATEVGEFQKKNDEKIGNTNLWKKERFLEIRKWTISLHLDFPKVSLLHSDSPRNWKDSRKQVSLNKLFTKELTASSWERKHSLAIIQKLWSQKPSPGTS